LIGQSILVPFNALALFAYSGHHSMLGQALPDTKVHRFINSVTNLFPQDLVLSEHSTDGKPINRLYRNCESKH
jgi:hypothetical protein